MKPSIINIPYKGYVSAGFHQAYKKDKRSTNEKNTFYHWVNGDLF